MFSCGALTFVAEIASIVELLYCEQMVERHVLLALDDSYSFFQGRECCKCPQILPRLITLFLCGTFSSLVVLCDMDFVIPLRRF